MSNTLITLNEGGRIREIILKDATSQDVLNALLNTPSDETTIVENFLSRTGLIVSADTPDSSWVESIEFNAHAEEITFVSDAGARIPYKETFKGFLNALKAPSAGKLQNEYRRGLR